MTYWIIGGAIAIALIYLCIMMYRVVREVRPTMKAAHKAMSTMQRAAEQSQEIVYHMHSISENLARQSEQIQIIRAYATHTIDQVKLTASAVEPAVFTYKAVRSFYESHKNGTPKNWFSKILDKVI